MSQSVEMQPKKQQNPIKKQVRKGKEALKKLLNSLTEYDIEVMELLNLAQPSFKGNKIDFANIYKHAINLNINHFEIVKHNLLNDAIFECEVKLNYNFKIPHPEKEGFLYELKDINLIKNIRIVPELFNGKIDINGDYKPSIIFISECYVNALKEETERNKLE